MFRDITRGSIMQTTAALEDVHRNAEYFEYSKAADPIGLKIISRVPYHNFPASLYKDGPTRIVTLDLSKELGVDYPATGPGLLAHFVRVVSGEQQSLNPVATSQLLYVLAGQGRVTQAPHEIEYTQGAFVALPGGVPATIRAESDTALYYVNDAPLLSYLGVDGVRPRFEPTLYPAREANAKLAEVEHALDAAKHNRISVLLGNKHFPQTRTVTHTMWAMFGIVEPSSFQKPHRHQSIALDLIVDCKKGCYTLVGTELGGNSEIANPVRVDWEPGLAFVTPPGYWHAHYNESDGPAHVIPLQDAGLHSYLRTLDIRFT
jgi:gentisate 1,2-dioxygenase